MPQFNMFFVPVFVCLLFFDHIVAQMDVAKYCTDLQIQEHIAMHQLTGMWFVIEVISHKQEPTPSPIDYETCAVVTISDKPYAVLTPMYKDFYYNQSYGPGYTSYDAHTPPTDPPRHYQHYNINRNKFRDPKYKEQIYEKYKDRKPLRISWDQDGTTVAYAAYYTQPAGIWYIYGPDMDAYSPPGISDHLVGKIQVLKAVGSHIVLTFCHRWPEEKLYTAILSRTPKLNREEVTGVHNLIRRNELVLLHTQKMCLLNDSTAFSANHIFVFLLAYILVITV